MSISRKTKKAEAIRRLKSLDVYYQTIRDFESHDLVSISEPPFGAYFWVDDERKKIIDRFEANFNALVYIGILTFTNFGRILSLFYVSDHREEWKRDREDLELGTPCVYVYNLDDPDLSEIGYIGFEKIPASGGLERTS